MSELDINNDDEIIDIKPFLNGIKKAFKSLLKTLISIIVFYKKKAVLFIILFVLGFVGGYFLDKKWNIDKSYRQEIIIQPKYGTQNYIYNFIENIDFTFNDRNFLHTLKIDSTHITNIKKITLEPIIRATDVLDGLHNKKKIYKE